MPRRRLSAVVLAALLFGLPAGAGAEMAIRFEKEVVEQIRKGDLHALTTYLLGDGNPGATDNQGQPLLVIATRAGRPDMVELLLRHRARVDAQDRLGNTALFWAAEEGRVDIAETLIAAGAQLDPQNSHGLTPLMAAVRDGQVQVVRRLIAAGADPRVSDYTGRDAFGWAGGARGPLVMNELNKAR